MTTTTIFKTPAPLATKINRLYRLLIKERNLFEAAAAAVSDNTLRCSILSLAQQSNQYATELSSHLASTSSFRTETSAGVKVHTATQTRNNIIPDENGVLKFCKSNERKLETAYRKILQESALYEGLQKMMSYQLFGIESASMQLKLFSTLKQARRVKQLLPQA